MATLQRTVAASSDYAYQDSADAVTLDAGNVTDNALDHVGMRFTNITIPPGSTINSATLTVTMMGTGTDEPKHQLRGQLALNAAAFSTSTDDVDSRTRTTATVQWNSTNLGAAAGDEYEWGAAAGDPTNGADISAIIQEIIDQVGWASGNALVLICEQYLPSDGARDLQIRSYTDSFAVGGNPPILDIDYTAGGPAMAALMASYRRRRA